MAGRTDRASDAWIDEHKASTPSGADLEFSSARLERLTSDDANSAALLDRSLGIALGGLSRAYRDGRFAFRLDGSPKPGGTWHLTPSGRSMCYAAIAALGLLRLPGPAQRRVVGGDTCDSLITGLTRSMSEMTSRGDVALLCWVAAEAGQEAQAVLASHRIEPAAPGDGP
jgi:hypothetical protein